MRAQAKNMAASVYAEVRSEIQLQLTMYWLKLRNAYISVFFPHHGNQPANSITDSAPTPITIAWHAEI